MPIEKRLNIKEQQEVMTSIMKQIHEYCVKHNIKYLLTYGSLLGAVRHQGFIPWDNDMDIVMLREDYDRFLSSLEQDPISDNIKSINYLNNKNFHYLVTRIADTRTKVEIPYIYDQIEDLGLWVDVFPADSINEAKDGTLLKKQQSQINKWMYINRSHIYKPESPIHKIIQPIINFVFPNTTKIDKKIEDICKRYNSIQTECVGSLYEPIIGLVKRSDFNDPILLKFGDYSFYCPKNYEFALRKMYGDYMVLPDEKDRFTHEIISYYK